MDAGAVPSYRSAVATAAGPTTTFSRTAPNPSTTTPATKDSRRGVWITVAIVAALAGATVFTLRGHGDKSAPAPKVLAPRAPSAGLPTNLGDVVRMRAESARHNAMQAIQAATEPGRDVDAAALASMQPTYQWLDGETDSKDSDGVSVQSGRGVIVIAVAATNHICAFGRWAAPAPAEYVTMANVAHCRASAAPDTGWATEAGGAASDLPDDQP